MYRCTECHAEYEVLPDFCDCGNDSFEEFFEEASQVISYEESYEEEQPVKKVKKPKLSKEELAELEEEKMEKIKSLIALAVSLVLCICVFFLPPHKKAKMQKVQEKVAKQNVKLPSVKTFWIDELPRAFKKNDPLSGLPLLNEHFKTISPELREYLIKVGKEFNRRWNTTMVEGSGDCTVQFIIDKEGGLKTKTIISSSNNQMIDDSVNLLLTHLTGFDMPPDDYKGEKIYITFSIDEKGLSKVSYPSK